ncbi:hypothetical protein QJQ45_010597 [Haematococcus lacustris]|nr:hypothetical protein QJQ45_010597 [Haematococcus lacustris]
MWPRVNVAWSDLITGADWRRSGFIPDGVDPVLLLGALIAGFFALCANFKQKIAMGHPGPRRRALLERHKAIRAKLSPTELPALETALATPQQSSRGASTWGHKRPRTCLGRGAQQQLSMDQQQLQGAQHQLAQDQQQLQDAQHQLSLNQQQLQGAQHQLAVDQQLLQDAQHQVALDQQQLKGAQQQLALDQQQLKGAQQQQAQALEQLQGAQQQQAQAFEQLQNSRTGLERSELLLRQHMDACMSCTTRNSISISISIIEIELQQFKLSLREVVDKLNEQMPSYIWHHFVAHHQLAVFRRQQQAVQEKGDHGRVVISCDWSERLTVERPTEIQSDHWHHHNVGIFVACAYFRNDRDEYREETVYILTDGKDQSAAVTQAALHQVLDYLQGERCMVMKQLCMWSDGCAAQFKGTPALQLHRRMAMRYKVLVWWSYGATSHFKGRHDSEGGVFKHSMAARVLADHPDLSAECKAQQLAGPARRPPTILAAGSSKGQGGTGLQGQGAGLAHVAAGPAQRPPTILAAGSMSFLDLMPYRFAQLGDTDSTARQRAAWAVLGHFSYGGMDMFERPPCKELVGDLLRTYLLGVLSSRLEQLLALLYKPAHITNAACETALKPLSSSGVEKMSPEQVAAHVKAHTEDLDTWVPHITRESLAESRVEDKVAKRQRKEDKQAATVAFFGKASPSLATAHPSPVAAATPSPTAGAATSTSVCKGGVGSITISLASVEARSACGQTATMQQEEAKQYAADKATDKGRHLQAVALYRCKLASNKLPPTTSKLLKNQLQELWAVGNGQPTVKPVRNMHMADWFYALAVHMSPVTS